MTETVGLVIGIGDPLLNRAERFIDRCIAFNALPQSFENIQQEFDSARKQFDAANRRLSQTPLPQDIADILNIDKDSMNTAVTNINATVRNLQKHFPDSTDNNWPKLWVIRFLRTRGIESRLNEIQQLVKKIKAYERHVTTCMLIVKNRPAVENREDVFKSLLTLPRDDKNVLTDFSPEARDEGRIESVAKSHIVDGNSALTAICGLYGMGVVGKTTSMISLGHDSDVQRCFPDGVHFMKFGQGVTEDEVIREFARIVELSGGNKVSQKIKSTKSIRDAVQQTATWFHGRKVLFLCDDIWPMVSNAKGIMAELRNLSAAPGICVVVTTRDQYIANEADDQIPCSPLKPQSDISRSILLIRAGVSMQEYEASSDHTKHLVNLILDKCGGIPLTLTIAGASIHFLVQNREMRWKDALADHCRKLEENEINAGDANPLFQKYPSFRSTVLSSLQIADGWSTRHCTENCIVPFQCSSLFKRLCILRKKSSINDFVLTKIWNELHASDVSIVAERLLSLRLIQPEGDGMSYSLHDLVLDFCVDEGKESDAFRANAVSVLSAYMSPIDFQSDLDLSLATMSTEGLEAITRHWWDHESTDDCGFLFANLARLLVHAGLHVELVGLLTNARWFLIRQRIGGILVLRKDFKQLIDELRSSHSNDQSALELIESLKILQGSASAMSNYVERNSQELAAQSHARLLDLDQSSSVALQRFLQTTLEITPKPYLLPHRRYWPDEHGTSCISVPLPIDCWFIGADADMRIVRVKPDGLDVVYEIDFQGDGAVTDTIRLPGDDSRCISMSPDGSMLVLGRDSGNIAFWSVTKREKVWETSTDVDFIAMAAEVNTRRTNRVSWDSSGRIFVLCGDYRNVHWFDLSERTQKNLKDESSSRSSIFKRGTREVGCFNCFDSDRATDARAAPQANLRTVAVSCGGGRAVAGGLDGSLLCWEIAPGSDVGSPILWRCQAHSIGEFGVRTVCMTNDGMHVASGGHGELKLWNGGNGAIVETVSMNSDVPLVGTFCSGGSDLIISTKHGKVQWRGASSGRLESEFEAPKACNIAFVASDDGGQAVCAGEDGVVRMWDRDGSRVGGAVPPAHAGGVWDLYVSLDGARILTLGTNLEAKLWDRSGVTCTGRLGRRDEKISAAAISADGLHAVTGNLEGGLMWWDSGTGQLIRTHNEAHDGRVQKVTVSQDGSKAISLGGEDRKLCYWDGRTGARLATHSLSDVQTHTDEWVVARVAIDWSGRRFAITVERNVVMCTTAEPGGAVTRVRAVKWRCKFRSVGVSGDGTRVVTGDREGAVQVWAWGGQRPVWEAREAHGKNYVWGVALSEDGTWMASGASDRVLKVWREAGTAGAHARGDDSARLEAVGRGDCVYEIFCEATVAAMISHVAISRVGGAERATVVVGDWNGGVWVHELVAH